MQLDDFVEKTGEWLKGTGPFAHIVLSSRVRLARNLTTAPFTNRATREALERVIDQVCEATQKEEDLKGFHFFRLNDLDNTDRQFLVERHLMSLDHANHPKGRGLLISSDETVSIMINEEDHLRIQMMQSGFNILSTWSAVDHIDNLFSQHLPFAFSSRWGFLTACPTNTGTAMRGSMMLHLPALVMTKQIKKVLDAISKLSFASRGFYGEGTEAVGNFYQISNQVSLGQSEPDIIENINGLIKQIIEQEEQARQLLLVQNKPLLEDKIFRAWGILKNVRVLSSQEAIELLSMVRLGLDMGFIRALSYKTLNKLFMMIQPAHLQKIEGKKLNPFERDIKRADSVRQQLNQKEEEDV